MKFLLWTSVAIAAICLAPVLIYIARNEYRRLSAIWKEHRRIRRLESSGIIRLEGNRWVLDPPCNACGRLGAMARWHDDPAINISQVEFKCPHCGAEFAHKAISEQMAGISPHKWSSPAQIKLVGPEAEKMAR